MSVKIPLIPAGFKLNPTAFIPLPFDAVITSYSIHYTKLYEFSKSQQDSLLGAVEDGTITLIGATTENPSFEVISPLLSRCQVYILNHLDKDSLLKIVDQACKKDAVLKEKKITLKESQAMLRFSGGDARKLLNVLELRNNFV